MPPVTVKQELSAQLEMTQPQAAPVYDYFPLRACSQDEIEESRFHIMKFHSNKKVNIKDFEEPVRLHRKDPKNLQFQLSMKELEQKKIDDAKKEEEKIEKRREYLKKKGIIDLSAISNEQIDDDMELETLSPEERERREYIKKRQEEELRKQEAKAKALEQVAPDGGARKTKKQIFKKKTRQIKVYDEDKRRLRYEEFYPWVLEDYDAKQAWVGNYEAGSSNDNYCLLVLDNANKCFKLIPVEKFYKFTARNKYATLTLEEAEAKMKEGNSSQRWLMKKMAEEVARGERVDSRYRKKFRVTSSTGNDDPRRSDDEDIDFDEEFQDDEEAPIMEGPEEDQKLVEGKMKKEMLKANNLIERGVDENDDDDDDDFDDLFEIKPSKKIDKEGKKLRNALAKNALNEVYDSDDEENPYFSESELEPPEDDTETATEVKKEEDQILKESPEEEEVKKEKKEPKIFVKSHNHGFITLGATKDILSQFPKGEWNPRTAIKRRISDDAEGTQTPIKKIKIKMESGSNDSPTSANATITKQDIDDLLVNGPIELTVLIRSLKKKLSRDPSSRGVLKQILIDHFVLKHKNKMVYKK